MHGRRRVDGRIEDRTNRWLANRVCAVTAHSVPAVNELEQRLHADRVAESNGDGPRHQWLRVSVPERPTGVSLSGAAPPVNRDRRGLRLAEVLKPA